MTDREIELSKRQHDILRYWLRGLVRHGTPSRLGVHCGGTLLWDCANDRQVLRDDKTIKGRG